jgi:hypothetical protein
MGTNVNFTDEAAAHAELTSGVFSKYDKNYRWTTPRCLVRDFKKPTTAIPEDWKIPKMDGAGPGTYDMEVSFYRTQNMREFLVAKQTGQRKAFTDTFAKLYEKNPAVGTYKEIDKGFKIIRQPLFDDLRKN